jgi:Ca-activated chloride channel homolog
MRIGIGVLGTIAVIAAVTAADGVRAQNAAPPPQAPAADRPQAPQAPPEQAPPAQTPAGPETPPEPTRPQQPAFRAGVDLVSLNVTVVDGTQHYITSLTQPDFLVYEDGVKQDLTFFNRANLPIALSILLDSSASMEDKLATAQDAAIGFSKRLRREDLAQVIDFDSRVQIIQGFTSSVPDLENAIRRTNAGGSTSLYNAIYIALKELKKSKAASTEDVRRQAIVVLSDGEDTSSLVSFEEVLELAKRSETAIYAIGIRSREVGQMTKGFSEADFVLRQLSQETGGRVFFARQISELANIYGQIADELSSQYTIGYTSKNPKRDGAYRRLIVRVNQPNSTARTKQGYYGPTS